MSEYEIGFGKPPVHSRFKPGQSGNPKGRPRGARGLKAEFRRELDELVEITENGKVLKLPKRRVVIKALIAKAANKDVRAANSVIQHMILLEGLDDDGGSKARLSAAEEQILARFLGESKGSPNEASVPPRDE